MTIDLNNPHIGDFEWLGEQIVIPVLRKRVKRKVVKVTNDASGKKVADIAEYKSREVVKMTLKELKTALAGAN